MMEAATLEQVATLIRRGRRFLCTAHARVDGDALGAMLVSAHGLRALGKEVVLYNQESVPRRLRFLPGATQVVKRLPRTARFDATLVHDTGARHLLGERFPDAAVTGPLIILDHHEVATDFGAHTLRDPTAASSGVVAWRLLRALGATEATMGREVATSLLVSLVEDTGWFRYASTNPEALHLASACVAAGAAPWELALELDESNSVASLRLLQLVLSTLDRRCDGRLAMLTLTDEQMHEAQATPDDVLKLVNYARGLRGVEVGALLTHGDKDIYVSLRGKGRVNVAQIAARFGGGGHRGAAGCTLPAAPDAASRAAARERLVAAVAEALAAGPGDGEVGRAGQGGEEGGP
jgi:phosphoesterase RecJ-like protein